MKKELEDLLKAHKGIFRKDKYIYPTLFAESDKKEYSVICLAQFPEGTSKEEMMRLSGVMLKQKKVNVQSITLVNESWIKKVKPSELVDIKKMEPISKQKDREMAISISYWDLLGDEKIVIYQPFKVIEQKVVWDKPIEVTNKTDLQFNLLNYFWQGFMSDVEEKGGE